MTIYKEFAELLLPEGLLTYYDLIDFKKSDEILKIHLEEKKDIPIEYKNKSYRLNGFLPAVTIKDFPIREFKVELKIKRRRWLLTDSNTKVTRDLDLLASGTRITKSFADFLKELARYSSDKYR
jgi:hypothetical protein